VQSTCNAIGLTAPVVRPNFWRADPTSSNLSTVPFYSCPYPGACTGGNNSEGRCAEGYDNASATPCATCSPGHVLQGKVCVFCPGLENSNGPSIALWGATGGVVFLLFISFVYIFCRPALGKTDETRIIQLIKSVGVKKIWANMRALGGGNEVDIGAFTNAMAHLKASLSEVQLHQLFHKIDANNSKGIDMQEFDQYVNKRKGSVSEKISAAQDHYGGTNDKQEKLGEVGNRKSQLFSATGSSTNSSGGGVVGGMFMKIKLLVGFGQVLSFFPVTFGKKYMYLVYLTCYCLHCNAWMHNRC